MGPRALTCSVACRQHRSRRLRAANIDADALEATRGVRELVRRGGKDAIQEVLKQELAPVVREAIDQDVVEAIGKMVNLTTRAVEVLADDLESEDRVMRQRAAALVVKYTVGHPALVKPVDETPPQMTVHFNLPRPEGVQRYDEEGEVLSETQVCDNCNIEKPLAEFESGSDRCTECFERMRAAVLETLG